MKRHPRDLKHVNKDITFDKERIQKEEYNNELWKVAFDYISQNVEYKHEIVNSQSKLRRSQCLRKLNQKYFNLDYVQWDSVRTKLVMAMVCI